MTTPENDRARAGALITEAFAGTRYESHALELLTDPECVVIENVQGVLIYAPIAGAVDVIKVHLNLGDSRALDALPHVRLVVAELPADAPFAEMTAALIANGFREEGRIDDFVTDGIALQILTKRLA